MKANRTLAYITSDDTNYRPLPGTDALMFGIGRTKPSAKHAIEIASVAKRFGCEFVQARTGEHYGHCFMVHREIAKLHDGYANEVLIALANRGLLQPSFDCATQ